MVENDKDKILTVAELIEELKKCQQDLPVVIFAMVITSMLKLEQVGIYLESDDDGELIILP